MDGEQRGGGGNSEGKGGSWKAAPVSGAGGAAAAGGGSGSSAARVTAAAATEAASSAGTGTTSKPTRTHEERWEESFRRLVAFQKKHGHCNIPYRYEEDPFLGRWVSLQRSIYKGEASSSHSGAHGATATATAPALSGESAAQRDRVRRLNEIGFEWNPQETRHVSWEQRYGELCDFVARNGHARVPLGWKENIQLSHWVSAQRREYKLLRKGLPSRLTHDRLQKLEKINFLWKAGRGGPRAQPALSLSSSMGGPAGPLQHDTTTGSSDFQLVPDAPSEGAAGGLAPTDSQATAAPTQASAANPPGIATSPAYAMPPGTAFLLTNAGAFPAILAQPSVLAPLQGLIPQQAGAPADPSQTTANATSASAAAAAAAAAAATVLNLLPLLAQTAAATAATAAAPAAAAGMATGASPTAAAPEDPSVAALRLLMNSGIVAPSVGGGLGGTGVSLAAPLAYGAAPATAPTAASAAPTAPGAPSTPALLDPQAAMNLALTLQLLTRAQAASGVQQPQQPAAPSADGTGKDPGPETAQT